MTQEKESCIPETEFSAQAEIESYRENIASEFTKKAYPLIFKDNNAYVNSQLYNCYSRFNQLFPKLLSDDINPLFKPVPGYPTEHWKNKNRRVWTPEEISQLSIDAFGHDAQEAESIRLILLGFDEFMSEDRLNRTTASAVDKWTIGKIIKIGPLAFSSEKFPLGPTATYGDWVHYMPINAKRTKFENGIFCITLDDVSILSTVENSDRFINT